MINLKQNLFMMKISTMMHFLKNGLKGYKVSIYTLSLPMLLISCVVSETPTPPPVNQQFTITFDVDGGTPVAEVKVNEGEKVTKPADPTKTGYTFTGWYKEAGGTGKTFNFDTDTITADTTLYAGWEKIASFTVTFDVDGGTPVDPIEDVLSGTTIEEPTLPEKSEFKFIGWFKKEGGAGGEAFVFATDAITQDTTIYAKWEEIVKYRVTFEVNGGTPIDPIEDVLSGTTIKEPAPPTKTGTKFIGWYKESSLNTVFDFSKDVIIIDTKLYAGWEELAKLTVNFDVNGGEMVDPIADVLNGATIQEPTAPTRLGFSFIGWYKGAGGTGEAFNFDTDTITTNTTLYAKWEELAKLTVTFDVDGGTAVNPIVDVLSGATIQEPVAPTQLGFNFKGWYKETGGTGEAFNFDTGTIVANTTLYAGWEELAKLTVTFDVDGGTPVDPIADVLSGTTITEPAAPTQLGFSFIGWYKGAGGIGEAFNFDTDTITANTTLYAKWEELAKLTVNFDANGGTAVGSIVDVLSGTTITEPAAPTQLGFNFKGWYKEAGGTGEAFNFDTDTITANTTLYAKWEELAKLTVTFDVDGGTTVNPIVDVLSGATIQEPVAPTQLGFNFKGWYKETGGTGEAFNFDTGTIVANTTLYAGWEELAKLTVTFDVDGGTPVDPIADVLSGATIQEPTAPTQLGFGFIGWYKGTGGTDEAFNFDTDTITANTTLYAKWEQLAKLTVTFDVNGGTPVDSIADVLSGATIQTPTAPTQIGFGFIGWYKGTGGTGEAFNFDTDTITANTTLYAKWEELAKLTVTFDVDGGTAVAPIVDVLSGATIPEPTAPTRGDYTFDGWFTDTALTSTFDFANPITTDLTLYVKWVAQIKNFQILAANNPQMALEATDRIDIVGIIDQTTKTINLPQQSAYVYLEGLIAEFAVTAGATVQVSGIIQTSGVTANDYTTPLAYEVVSEKGTKTTYTVTLTKNNLATILDENFRGALQTQFPSAFSGELLDITSTEVTGFAETIDVNTRNINSLKGIEFFPQLNALICRKNSLTSLDLSNNPQLHTLNCMDNLLTSLDVSDKPQINAISCQNNRLQNLTLNNLPLLQGLACQNNQLTKLDVSSTGLLFLTISYNQLVTLDASTLNLHTLQCIGNQLNELDITDMKGTIKQLWINAGENNKNSLTILKVHENVQQHNEIKEVKTNRGALVKISTYDDNNALVCDNYDPNTNTCND